MRMVSPQPASLRPGYLLKRAQHDLNLSMERALGTLGLTTSRYAALSVLEERGPMTNAELARRCFVSPQTMIRIVADLHDAGLVDRTTNPQNRRERLVALTGDAEERLVGAHSVVGAIEDRLLEGMTAQRVAELVGILGRMIANLGISEAPDRPGRAGSRAEPEK